MRLLGSQFNSTKRVMVCQVCQGLCFSYFVISVSFFMDLNIGNFNAAFVFVRCGIQVENSELSPCACVPSISGALLGSQNA